MSTVLGASQKALYAVLNGNLSASLQDYVAEDTALPLVLFGAGSCNRSPETKLKLIWDVTWPLIIVSAGEGFKEVEDIAKEIFDLLEATMPDMTADGYTGIISQVEEMALGVEEDTQYRTMTVTVHLVAQAT